jgi:hypothetical protein
MEPFRPEKPKKTAPGKGRPSHFLSGPMTIVTVRMPKELVNSIGYVLRNDDIGEFGSRSDLVVQAVEAYVDPRIKKIAKRRGIPV